MSYKEWAELLGRDSEDKEVLSLLMKRGVKRVPPIKKDRLDASVEFDDMMLKFATAELFPSRSDGGDGASLLATIVLPLKGQKWGEYKGEELPFELSRKDSQKKLRKRFGKPSESDSDLRWDEWVIGGLRLRVKYIEDYNELATITFGLPDEQ
jgi:hypothetical protein